MNGKIVALLMALFCCVLVNEAASADVGPQCLLPLEHGPCRAMMPRYGYNPATNQCEQFMYGGCRGNQNNFDSLKNCQQACA